MQRRARRAVGEGWVMLPHAVYFFDPLFSAGNAHTLLGIQRLARLLEQSRDRDSLTERLVDYEQRLFREIEFLDWLIHGCYRTFGRFDLLASYVMYYFAGAIQSEMQLRNGSAGDDTGFLFSDHAPFRAALKASFDSLSALDASSSEPPLSAADFRRQVATDIAPYNPVGFCDPARRNMYYCF
jgi:FADH2 O2-dependent halogenase